MRRTASEVIRSLEGRVARLERSASKEPRWITQAISALLESRETRAKRISDLEVRRNGKVWEYYENQSAIKVTSDADDEDYVIYANDDEVTERNEQEAYDRFSSMSVADIVGEYPWAEDIVKSVARLPHGDVMHYSTLFSNQFEGMDDDVLIEMAGLQEEKEEYEDGLEHWSGRVDPDEPNYSGRAEVMVFDYNNMLNELPDRARNELQAQAEEEAEKGLSNYPFEYLTEEQGWSEAEVLEAFGYLDEDEVKEAIRQLGASEPEFEYFTFGDVFRAGGYLVERH